MSVILNLKINLKPYKQIMKSLIYLVLVLVLTVTSYKHEQHMATKPGFAYINEAPPSGPHKKLTLGFSWTPNTKKQCPGQKLEVFFNDVKVAQLNAFAVTAKVRNDEMTVYAVPGVNKLSFQSGGD